MFCSVDPTRSKQKLMIKLNEEDLLEEQRK